jgi:hypothetical protein
MLDAPPPEHDLGPNPFPRTPTHARASRGGRTHISISIAAVVIACLATYVVFSSFHLALVTAVCILGSDLLVIAFSFGLSFGLAIARATPGSSPASLVWRLAAFALFVGGALGFVATFLPLATAFDPDTGLTTLYVPAQDFATLLQFNLQNPATSSLRDTLGLAFIMWGIPLVLAVLGATLQVARQGMTRARTRAVRLVLVISLLLCLIGAVFALFTVQFAGNTFLGTGGRTITVQYGATVDLCGYGCALVALVALIWLLDLPLRPRLTR